MQIQELVDFMEEFCFKIKFFKINRVTAVNMLSCVIVSVLPCDWCFLRKHQIAMCVEHLTQGMPYTQNRGSKFQDKLNEYTTDQYNSHSLTAFLPQCYIYILYFFYL